MKNTPFFLRIVAMLTHCLLFAGIPSANAQSPAPEHAVFQVDGLTSALRDGIVQQLQNNSELRLSFACVPAGILVFESMDPMARGSVKQRSLQLLSSRTSAAQVNELAMATAEAELAFAQVRNQ